MTAPEFPHPELAEATIQGIRQQFESGEMTAARLVDMHLQRIHAMDQSGPYLRSIIELNPDALDIAERLDRERAAGTVRGPLHGIPVVVKDNIDTGDRMLTTAGSLSLAGAPATADAPVVTCLRNAGMVILGKSNLSEWANFRSTRSSSGWSGRGRQTLNPHVLDRSPSGSSSGSAVAAAAGLTLVAVGTETDGSVVSPSSLNGVVGFKPTVGRVSNSGIVPISASQDTAGPHGRCVADTVALYECMVGAHTTEVKLDAGALRGRRIGVLRQPYTGNSEHSDRIYESALVALGDAGAQLVDPVEIPAAVELHRSSAERTILAHEFKVGLNAYLRTRRGVAVGSLQDVIDFNVNHADQEMPYFRQEWLEKAQTTSGLEVQEYLEATELARSLARKQGIDWALETHDVDALVAPTEAPAFVIDRINGDRFRGYTSQLAAVAGYPHITVPAGIAFDALPVGLSFFTSPEREADLLAMAYAFEQTIQLRPTPQYLPTLPLP